MLTSEEFMEKLIERIWGCRVISKGGQCSNPRIGVSPDRAIDLSNYLMDRGLLSANYAASPFAVTSQGVVIKFLDCPISYLAELCKDIIESDPTNRETVNGTDNP